MKPRILMVTLIVLSVVSSSLATFLMLNREGSCETALRLQAISQAQDLQLATHALIALKGGKLTEVEALMRSQIREARALLETKQSKVTLKPEEEALVKEALDQSKHFL